MMGALSDAELIEVARTRPAGDPQRDLARETLVRRYEAVVRGCVQPYRSSPEPIDDLMQVGYVGLMKAINNFDPEIGENLAAYARPCISGEIKRHFRDKRWQIRVRRSAQELRLRINAATGELTQRLARTPTCADFARYLQVSEAEIASAQLASQAFQVAYLDGPATPGEDTNGCLADFVGAEDQQIEQMIAMDSVWRHCAELPEREQTLLMMRFFGNMTQNQIAEELGISQMHVSRLLSYALGYLRERIDSLPGE